MLQNAYFLAKIGADTAENEQHFAEILPKTGNYPYGSLANAKAVMSSSWLIAESGRGSHGRAELRALTREQHYASGIPKVEQTAPLLHGAAAWASDF